MKLVSFIITLIKAVKDFTLVQRSKWLISTFVKTYFLFISFLLLFLILLKGLMCKHLLLQGPTKEDHSGQNGFGENK